ncbi:DUF3471 domain-containing protein [Paraflavitalea soli]|uniref:DUF3471 domain-containing protein n=1 Tax=Paraflavitalea soli TaxID=2315862 RepID=A0A3B7MLM9_9BACT|nr:serine hydrolase [Paraflavitalea soli]AXY72505.1 DUF3471 domain-containing protein [Paraflavitalea soli]
MKKLFAMIWAIGFAQYACTQNSTAQKLDELMQAYTNQGKFSGSVLVARHGQVLLDKGYGYSNYQEQRPNDPHTVFQIASVTKQFTSTLVLKLVEFKKLALTDKLSKFYPGYPHGDSITIEHLLTHTSGIYDYTRNGELMHLQTVRPVGKEEMMGYFRNQPLDFAPGTNWSYSNAGYFLLGCIIEQVTGQPYEKAIRQYIFDPLKMQHSGFDFIHLSSMDKAVGYKIDSTGNRSTPAPVVDSTVPFSAGAVYSTVEDLYKWHQGLQQYRIIGKDLMQKAYTPFKNNYGYGWIIDSLYGKRMVSHSGGIFGFRSDLARVPEDDVCVILLSNTEIPGMGNITRRVLAALYGKPYAIPVQLKAVAIREEVLKRYTGTYKIEANGVLVDVVLESGRLMARPHNGPPSELLALDDSHFFLSNEHEFKIYFEMDEKGQVLRMMINPNGDPRPANKIK